MPLPRPEISNIPDNVSDTAVTDASTTTTFASLSLAEMADLIRSLSTFLAITTSISNPIKQLDKKHPSYKTLSRLDRIATLLITKDGSDVAAVVYSGSFNSTVVVGIVEQSESDTTKEPKSNMGGQSESSSAEESPPIQNLFIIKNSNGNDNNQTGRILPPRVTTDSKGKSKTGRNMDTGCSSKYLKVVIESGPLSLSEHAQYLETMFNQQLHTGDVAAKKYINQDLKFCTYFQCRAKILQRLTVRLHPRCHVGFFDVFRPEVISREELREGCKLIAGDKAMTQMDERVLYKRMFAYTEFDFKFDNQQQLILDTESCIYFHMYIWKLLSSIVENLQQLKAYTDPTKNKAKGFKCAEEEACNLLTTIKRNFSHLSDLVNESSTFRKHMRNPAILKWFVQQAKASMGGNQVYNKNIRYILEDEEALNSAERISRDTYGSFMKWLQLSTQWTQAIADLTNFIVSPITVTILQGPCTLQSKRQTPLEGLLKFVLDECSKRNLRDVKKALQEVAMLRSQSRLEEFPGDWRKLTLEEWDKWGHNFAGKMHCEAMLACLKRMDVVNGELACAQHMSKGNLAELKKVAAKLVKCEPLIGCSKACCLCCSVYLEYGEKLGFKGSSGRVFPWVIPVWETDRSIYEKMLEELKTRAWASLKELGVLTVDRRHSGSDDGKCGPILSTDSDDCSDSDIKK